MTIPSSPDEALDMAEDAGDSLLDQVIDAAQSAASDLF